MLQRITLKKEEIFVLSARDEQSLYNYASSLSSSLKRSTVSISAADVAYTLQVGRESMSHRLAVVASTIDELAEKLECVAKKHNSLGGVWIGSVKDNPGQRGEIESIINDKLLGYIEERKMERVAKHWVEGYDVPWYLFLRDREVKRIPLPTYPFKKERIGSAI